jgi:hypothetical protein
MTAPGETQDQILIGLARQAELFHEPDGTAYADLTVSGHRETWAVRDRAFKQWLVRGYYRLKSAAPSSDAMRSAIATIEAKARYDSSERSVHVRVAGASGKIYLDLADAQWRAVEVDVDGWRVVTKPPIRFRRPSGMVPLPEPVCGGSINTLRPFLNLSTDADFVLLVAWLLAVLRDRGPYPILVLSGEQGSAKSTAAKMLRDIVDPNAAPLRALPRDERDLFIAGNNARVVAFDNLSGLRQWTSDALCRLATGGSFATRRLYTDDDEMLLHVVRPIILGGIEDIVIRGDLADRSIFLLLNPIPDHKRRTEEELWRRFQVAHPEILGALLDAVSHGLRRVLDTKLPKLPRMADFAVWATACEGALWPPGTFTAAYNSNRGEAAETVIEADTVATAIRSMLATRRTWSGTATELMSELLLKQPPGTERMRDWPATPRVLSGRLRRAAPNLRKVGVHIDFARKGHGRDRMITIGVGALPSAASASSALSAVALPDQGFGADPKRTQGRPADATGLTADDAIPATVRSDPLKNGAADGADDADAKIPLLRDGKAP